MHIQGQLHVHLALVAIIETTHLVPHHRVKSLSMQIQAFSTDNALRPTDAAWKKTSLVQ